MPLQTATIKSKAELFKELENAPWGKVSGIYRDKTDPQLKVTSPMHCRCPQLQHYARMF
jgi:hypothetical protein